MYKTDKKSKETKNENFCFSIVGVESKRGNSNIANKMLKIDLNRFCNLKSHFKLTSWVDVVHCTDR